MKLILDWRDLPAPPAQESGCPFPDLRSMTRAFLHHLDAASDPRGEDGVRLAGILRELQGNRQLADQVHWLMLALAQPDGFGSTSGLGFL